MTTLYVDIETFSHSDVRRVGAYRHAEDPHFLILMAAWAHDDGPVRVETGPERIRSIPGLLDPGVRKVAHISSGMGSIADNTSGGAYAYRMSKAALNMASRSMAVGVVPRVALT